MGCNYQDSYCLWIHNRSGIIASYGLVAASPYIQPAINTKEVSMPIVCSFRNVPSGQSLVRFEIPKQFHAVCGIAIYGGINGGPALEIFDQRPVICARSLENGDIELGTTLSVTTKNSQPAFADVYGAKESTFESVETDSQVDKFVIQTQADFTVAEAKSRGYFLGICGPWRDVNTKRKLGFYATWMPQPNTIYSIQPRLIFGLVLGDFQPRSKFDGNAKDICELDFTRLGLDDIEVIHTERNELVVIIK